MSANTTTAYVLAKLHRSATSQTKAFAAPVTVGSRSSTRELVTAIDAQGVNVYNVKTNQLVTSHSLSPSTRFLCPPICMLDRKGDTRTTFAAMRVGPDAYKLQRWHQQGLSSEPTMLIETLPLPIIGMQLASETLLLVGQDGSLIWFSFELKELARKNIWAGRPADARVVSYRFVDANPSLLYCLSKSTDAVWNDMVTLPTALDGELQVSSATSLMRPFTKAYHIAINTQGTTASWAESHIVIQAKGDADTTSLHIANYDESIRVTDIKSLLWLNDSHLLVVRNRQATVWDLRHGTAQGVIELPSEARATTLLQQTAQPSKRYEHANIVFASLNSIYLAPVYFAKSSLLAGTIHAQRPRAKTSNPWLVDVELQATWKESIGGISARARVCLEELELAQTGAEFDGVLEDYLFPQSTETPLSRKAAQRANKDKLGEATTPRKAQSQRKYAKKLKFDSYETHVSPSGSFTAHVLQLALCTLPVKLGKPLDAEASLDFIFQTGRFSLSSLPRPDETFAGMIEDAALRQSLVDYATSLVPEQLVQILQKQLVDDSASITTTSKVLSRLYAFDASIITKALRVNLTPSEIERFAGLLEGELHHRLSGEDETSKLAVHNDVLCSCTTAVVDALGISNVVLTAHMREMMMRLRGSVSRLIQETEEVSMVAACLAELLLKARLVEPSKTKTLQKKSNSNPQPQARETYLALDKVQVGDKAASARSKGLAKSLGVGRYTIEALEL